LFSRFIKRRDAIAGAGLFALGIRGRSSPAATIKEVGRVEARLAELRVTIPEVPAAVANYVPYVTTGNLVYLAGQIAIRDGRLLHPGVVPAEVSIEAAQAAARECAINLLAALRSACNGRLDRVVRCVRLDGFVASANDFTQQPLVMNGASDLLVSVFGDAGRHTRLAIGVNVLPLNACVEIAGVFEIE